MAGDDKEIADLMSAALVEERFPLLEVGAAAEADSCVVFCRCTGKHAAGCAVGRPREVPCAEDVLNWLW